MLRLIPIAHVRPDGHKLQFVETLVDAALVHEFFVRSRFRDRPFFEHDDAVGAPDGRNAMGNHDHRAIHHQIRQRPLHQHLGFGIQVRSGLIQNQNRRIFQHRARDRKTLPLPPAETHAAFPDQRIVTFAAAAR